MSKHDFSADEFAGRLSRARRAIADARLDWLLVFHPVSIHWLTGSDAKSYQAFQCLFVAADERPLVVLTRDGERYEFEDDSFVEDVRTWGGPEPEDPVEAFARLAEELRLRHSRVGLEVPAYYLHPHHYVRVKEFLGEALASEPTNLVKRPEAREVARRARLYPRGEPYRRRRHGRLRRGARRGTE
jgi:Xaa-Pro dipeptidase